MLVDINGIILDTEQIRAISDVINPTFEAYTLFFLIYFTESKEPLRIYPRVKLRDSKYHDMLQEDYLKLKNEQIEELSDIRQQLLSKWRPNSEIIKIIA